MQNIYRKPPGDDLGGEELEAFQEDQEPGQEQHHTEVLPTALSWLGEKTKWFYSQVTVVFCEKKTS